MKGLAMNNAAKAGLVAVGVVVAAQTVVTVIQVKKILDTADTLKADLNDLRANPAQYVKEKFNNAKNRNS